jgi:dephospho-CoA kinase
MLLIGVTGGIGSGKSEACRIFQTLGGQTLDSDSIAKLLMEQDDRVKKRVRVIVGADVYFEDGRLDRKALARLIFSDDSILKKINDVVHPAVVQFIENEANRLEKVGDIKLLFTESALIYEAGIEDMFDYIVMVYTTPEQAIARLVCTQKFSRADVLERMKTQSPPDKNAQRADFVIYNDGDAKELEARCRFVHSILLSLSK